MGRSRFLILVVFAGLFFYVNHQLLHFAEISIFAKTALTVFLFALFAIIMALPLYFLSDRRQHPEPWHDHFFRAAHYSMAYLNFIFSFIVIRDVASLILNFTPASDVISKLYSSESVGVLVLLPFVCMLLGTVVVRVGPKLKKVKIKSPLVSESLSKLRILQISDLHISPSLPVNFVSTLVEKVQSLKPDLILYTGDILDSHAFRHVEEFSLLKKVQPRYGNFYVPGNHEYYWNFDQGMQAFQALNWNILINQTQTVPVEGGLLQISGIPDPASKGFQKEVPDLEKVAKETNPEAFKILLSHQPGYAEPASKLGFDLQLSGHTHGGQFFPWNFLIGFFHKYSKGLYRIGSMQLYVNQGTGYWGPSLRLGTYCELTEFTLEKA